MKNITKLFTLIMVGFSTYTFAQATATASIGVNIVTPISITKSEDMVFGNIASNGSTGTILISTDGSRTPTGDITLPVAAGSPKAASFVVTGSGNYTYSISCPGSPIMLTGATEGVTVGTFVSNPASTGKLAAAGIQTVSVGATLSLPASTVAGSYINVSGLRITVNYN
jgi:Domain of unknown function (DUF4402)